MPAYKYTLKDGKTTLWYANFYYTDWTGTKNTFAKGDSKHNAKQRNMNLTSSTSSRIIVIFFFPSL